MTTAASEHRQVHWHLPLEVVNHIEALAAAEGSQPELIASRMLSAGVAEAGLTAAGRCSVRTGLCSQGPTPLPLQQAQTC